MMTMMMMMKMMVMMTMQWSERRVVAPIRLRGGVLRSSARALLLLGDAAGHVDPLTGEGIHTAMQGARIAADTLHEMFSKNNLSEEAARVYGETD
jgi:flavin-dependent dehydrogenase